MNELETNINSMIANGNRLELPTDNVFKNYALVKKTMIKAGGKYVKNGFVFPSDATEIKMRLSGGEKIDDKKKFQFFATPSTLAKRLVEFAEVGPTDDVLEPSAGQGAILEHIPKCRSITVVELMPENNKVLRKLGYPVWECDFLTLREHEIGFKFDRIIANPPFTNNQDIDHITHMYSLLDDSGILVSISSNSWRTGLQKKQVAFRDWLNTQDRLVLDLPAGTFKESGTNVDANIIVIYK
ncbi:methylase [Paraglaciecola Antarctic GD virus 1]|nr:methylase [Paraglaciecola Antarctic GD virus 1]